MQGCPSGEALKSAGFHLFSPARIQSFLAPPANTMASVPPEEALAKVIQCLEEQLLALTRSPQVLSQQPSNIQKYIDIIAAEGKIQSNAPKKRARDILRAAKAHSTELFVLCAVATNQHILGTVKWGRNEIFEVCGWWDKIITPTEIESLQKIWQEATQGHLISLIWFAPLTFLRNKSWSFASV